MPYLKAVDIRVRHWKEEKGEGLNMRNLGTCTRISEFGKRPQIFKGNGWDKEAELLFVAEFDPADRHAQVARIGRSDCL